MKALSDDYGRDLAGVESLQRKHDGFVRDLAALEEKVKVIGVDVERLQGSQPQASAEVVQKNGAMQQDWQHLHECVIARTLKLTHAHDYQQFLKTFRDLNSWIEEMMVLMTSEELAKDLATSEAQLLRHREYRGEIDARQASFDAFVKFGQSLLAYNHYAHEDIKQHIATLENNRSSMSQLWSRHQEDLENCRDIHDFVRDAEQASGWMNLRDDFMGQEQASTSLEEVEALLKKHDELEKAIDAQGELLKSLNRPTKV
jgi:spectrin alpha